MGFQTIECDSQDGILILRHNRPDNLNARNSQMYVEIMSVLQTASEDDETVGVLLTAKGRFFSAGMDFNNDPKLAYTALAEDSAAVKSIKADLPQRDAADVSTWLPVKFIEAFINFDKPLIGAVNGPAIGEGFSSLLHCDWVYAADSVYFWAPFARAGVAPEFCSTALMPKRLGASLAHAAMYLGRRISVEEAKVAGFVLDILPAGEPFENAVMEKLREGLALTGPPELRMDTLRAYKSLVYSGAERAQLIEQCHAEFELIRQRGNSGVTEAVQQHYAATLPKK